MYLYLFVLIPSVFVCYLISLSRTENGFRLLKNNILVALYSVVCVAALCTVLGFFLFFPDYNGTNFFIKILFHWIPYILLPALFYALFFIWSSDTLIERIESFIFFAMPFYSIWIVYNALSSVWSDSFFVLFIEPLLFLVMIFSVYAELNRIFKDSCSSSKKVLFTFLILIETVLPCAVYSLWYFNFNILIWLLASTVCVVFCLGRGEFKNSILSLLDLLTAQKKLANLKKKCN